MKRYVFVAALVACGKTTPPPPDAPPPPTAEGTRVSVDALAAYAPDDATILRTSQPHDLEQEIAIEPGVVLAATTRTLADPFGGGPKVARVELAIRRNGGCQISLKPETVPPDPGPGGQSAGARFAAIVACPGPPSMESARTIAFDPTGAITSGVTSIDAGLGRSLVAPLSFGFTPGSVKPPTDIGAQHQLIADRVVQMMNSVPGLELCIIGRDGNEAETKLARARAKIVSDLLASRGADDKRLRIAGTVDLKYAGDAIEVWRYTNGACF